MRPLSCALCCALTGSFARAEDPKPAEWEGDWVTIKGRVVLPADIAIPKRLPLVLNANRAQCLAKGPILDESVIVNPANRGIKNVVVWLRPDDNDLKTRFKKEEIHPADAQRKPAKVVIDQPCCMFIERVTCARVGDTIVVKNTAPIVHNFFWSSDKNGNYNANVPANGQWTMPNALVAESAPIQYKCTIHGWMTGYVRIFDHPYFAVTDEDGRFEIKDAPAGRFRIVYWHESGLRGGAKGRFGEAIMVAGKPAKTDSTMELLPTDFDVSPKP